MHKSPVTPLMCWHMSAWSQEGVNPSEVRGRTVICRALEVEGLAFYSAGACGFLRRHWTYPAGAYLVGGRGCDRAGGAVCRALQLGGRVGAGLALDPHRGVPGVAYARQPHVLLARAGRAQHQRVVVLHAGLGGVLQRKTSSSALPSSIKLQTCDELLSHPNQKGRA